MNKTLESLGKALLLLRFGRHICICLPSRRLSQGLRDRIRPLVFGGVACWCDRSSAD